jgi:hypothetical protein
MWIEAVIALHSLLLSGPGCMAGHQALRGTETFQLPAAQRRQTADQAKPFLGDTGSLWGYSAPVVLTLIANGDELQEDFSIRWFQFRGVGRKSHSRAE